MAGKKRHSNRKQVYEELELGYPLERLRTVEAPRNKEVLLHLFHHLQNDAKSDINHAARLTCDSVKTSWKGSNIQLACESTLKIRIVELHELFRYIARLKCCIVVVVVVVVVVDDVGIVVCNVILLTS